MKKRLYILPLFLLCIFSCKSSSDEKIKALMGIWYKKDIKIPDNWTFLNKKYVPPANQVDFSQNNSGFYVLHYFTADCDKCLEYMALAQKFIESKKQLYPNVKYVFVATGLSTMYVEEAVAKIKFEFPVFFEKQYFQFDNINKIPINNEALYGTMLLNGSRQLLLFGSLYDNPKAEKLYDEIINR